MPIKHQQDNKGACYQIPGAGSFLKALGNVIYNLIQEPSESDNLLNYQKCLCINFV